MELSPKNLKTRATKIPIPENAQKFFNQLAMERKEYAGGFMVAK